jgi:hypothetical protein
MPCRRRKAPTQSSHSGGCRRASVLARGPSWPPVPRLRLRWPWLPSGGGFGSQLQIGVWSEWDWLGVFGGEEEGGGVRSGPGAAGTFLLFHIISVSPSKQPRMVGSFLGVYIVGQIFVSARTNKRHHHLRLPRTASVATFTSTYPGL